MEGSQGHRLVAAQEETFRHDHTPWFLRERAKTKCDLFLLRFLGASAKTGYI